MAAITAAAKVVEILPDLDLPEPGRIYVERALTAGTTRNVSDGVSNVTGSIPIPLVGDSIPFESRTHEAVCLVQLAIDEDVIAIVAQPAPIKLTWVTRDGRKRTSWHRADYLVVYRDRVVLIECKPQTNLEQECAKAPDRFKKSANGEWISPAGIRATDEMGVCYEVFVPSPSDQVITRNIDFLWDYLWKPLDATQEAAIQKVVGYLSEPKYENLGRLIEVVGDADSVYLAIARRSVGFAWRTDLLRSPETATVYLDELHRKALSKAPVHNLTPIVRPESLNVGTYVDWLDQQWCVLSIRGDTTTLVNTDHRVATLTREEIQHLIASEDMSVVRSTQTDSPDEAQQVLQSTSPADLENALCKFEKLQAWERGELTALPDRTARDWRRKTEQAQIRYGLPVIGLIERNRDKGNRTSVVDPASKSLALESIEADYTTEAAISGVTAYGKYLIRCRDHSVQPVSYATYMNYVRKVDQDRQRARRHGKRYAYQRSGPMTQGPNALPPNGDRAWEIAHIDHTPVDIELVSKITGENLGQPWLTIMVDGWSRMILAMYLTFFAPSRVALMMIMRDCVRRWHRLPNKLIVDRGPEFQSTYFDKLLAGFNVTKLLRPTAEPRFGSVGERIFGTANTSLIHQLSGNTKNRVQRRGLSGSHDPAKFAVWTPDAFAELFEEWAFEVYPVTDHRGVGETPKDRMARSLEQSGDRGLTQIPYSEAFVFATLPETTNGNTRKVHRGVVSIDRLEYRGLSQSLNPFNGQTGYTRVAPDNPSRAWIFLENQWRELICTNDIVREYVERAVTYSHLELSARLSKAGKKIKDVDSPLLQLLERASETESQLMQETQTGPSQPSAIPTRKKPEPEQRRQPTTTPMQVQDIFDLEVN